jgi:branched-subunit amino acid transport protein
LQLMTFPLTDRFTLPQKLMKFVFYRIFAVIVLDDLFTSNNNFQSYS